MDYLRTDVCLEGPKNGAYGAKPFPEMGKGAETVGRESQKVFKQCSCLQLVMLWDPGWRCILPSYAFENPTATSAGRGNQYSYS